MRLPHVIQLAGIILGLIGFFNKGGLIFWAGVILCLIDLYMDMASLILKFPVIPIVFIIIGFAVIRPWYIGVGAGLIGWTTISFLGEIWGLFKGGATLEK